MEEMTQEMLVMLAIASTVPKSLLDKRSSESDQTLSLDPASAEFLKCYVNALV